MRAVSSLTLLRDFNVLCGSSDGFLCLYDIKSNKIIFKGEGIHSSKITCLLNLNKYQFISSAWDKAIKVWEY